VARASLARRMPAWCAVRAPRAPWWTVRATARPTMASCATRARAGRRARRRRRGDRPAHRPARRRRRRRPMRRGPSAPTRATTLDMTIGLHVPTAHTATMTEVDCGIASTIWESLIPMLSRILLASSTVSVEMVDQEAKDRSTCAPTAPIASTAARAS